MWYFLIYFFPINVMWHFFLIFLWKETFFLRGRKRFVSFFLKEGEGNFDFTSVIFYFFWTFLNNRNGKLWHWDINLMYRVSLFHLVKLNCNSWHNSARWTQLDGTPITPYVQHWGHLWSMWLLFGAWKVGDDIDINITLQLLARLWIWTITPYGKFWYK